MPDSSPNAPDADPFDAVRRRVLPPLLAAAAFDGFTPLALRRAAAQAGVSAAEVAAAFPGGPADAVAFWSSEADAAGAAAIRALGPARVRERVRAGVLGRLEHLRPHKEAARRAAAFLALPPHAALAVRLSWASADAVWRAMDDPSTDFNYYTKRATLVAVLTATTARWLADDSAEESATSDFLDARIENVMQFEKAKAQARKLGVDPEGMFGWLARLRYPEGR